MPSLPVAVKKSSWSRPSSTFPVSIPTPAPPRTVSYFAKPSPSSRSSTSCNTLESTLCFNNVIAHPPPPAPVSFCVSQVARLNELSDAFQFGMRHAERDQEAVIQAYHISEGLNLLLISCILPFSIQYFVCSLCYIFYGIQNMVDN